MIKKELEVQVNIERKEEEIFTTEEKIEIIKKVFEYCKGNYGLKNYSIMIVDSKKSISSYSNKQTRTTVEIINEVQNFKISLNITNEETFYNVNKMVEKLKLSKKDEDKVRLIFTCLHEIGHSLVYPDIKNMTSDEFVNYNCYNDLMYHKDIFKQLSNIRQEDDNMIYKYNHKEAVADNFAYSVLPSILKELGIQTDYFNINKSKGKKRLEENNIRKTIKKYYGISRSIIKPSLLITHKINLKKDDNINKYAKYYLDKLLVSDDDYYTACKVLDILTRYGYEILIYNYCRNNEIQKTKMVNYLDYAIKIDQMFSPKYKKYIEKTWFDMGARNIAYTEFPDVWRHLQEEGLI